MRYNVLPESRKRRAKIKFDTELIEASIEFVKAETNLSLLRSERDRTEDRERLERDNLDKIKLEEKTKKSAVTQNKIRQLEDSLKDHRERQKSLEIKIAEMDPPKIGLDRSPETLRYQSVEKSLSEVKRKISELENRISDEIEWDS